MKQTYSLIESGEIITAIALVVTTKTDKENSITSIKRIIEAVLPFEEEMIRMNDSSYFQWIKESNKRMRSICDHLNKNHL